MANTTIKISLPEQLKKDLKKLADLNNFPTVSGYIQNLIRENKEKVLEKQILKEEYLKVSQELKKGMESGILEKDPKVFFEELRQKKYEV